jgi:hypothetical protein
VVAAVGKGFADGVFNSLTAHIAVLDSQGVIFAVNDAWKRFARENGGATDTFYVGANYLTACENAVRGGDATAASARTSRSNTPVTRRPSSGGSWSASRAWRQARA